MQSESVRMSLLMIPILIVMALAVLAFCIIMLRMLFSQRFRALGVGLVLATCVGAMMLVTLIWSYRSAQITNLRQAEMAQMHAVQAEFRATEALRGERVIVPIDAAIRTEMANATAEFTRESQFDDLSLVVEDDDRGVTFVESPTAGQVQDQASTIESTTVHNSIGISDEEPILGRVDAGATSMPADQPAWLNEPDEFAVEGFPAKVVSSIPAPDVTTCVEDLSSKLGHECLAYVRSYTPWRIKVTPELVSSAIRSEYVESIGGSQKVVHKLLVFDRGFRQQAKIEIDRARVTERLGATGIISGVVLTSLTGLFGVFSFTHRRRERRLSSQQAAAN